MYLFVGSIDQQMSFGLSLGLAAGCHHNPAAENAETSKLQTDHQLHNTIYSFVSPAAAIHARIQPIYLHAHKQLHNATPQQYSYSSLLFCLLPRCTFLDELCRGKSLCKLVIWANPSQESQVLGVWSVANLLQLLQIQTCRPKSGPSNRSAQQDWLNKAPKARCPFGPILTVLGQLAQKCVSYPLWHPSFCEKRHHLQDVAQNPLNTPHLLADQLPKATHFYMSLGRC